MPPRKRKRTNPYQDFPSYPTPTKPIRARDGIKSHSQRGAFGRNWWARRWIEALERLMDPRRLARGRSYARQGQVLSIEEKNGEMHARVQGSRPTPYKVTIQLEPLSTIDWELVIDSLAEQALFTAQLLAGEMPDEIEQAFERAGVSLFPARKGDLTTECSCPDWANPCKHVAAAHYILGDRFDEDPFLLFRLRGRSQEQILAALRQRRAGQDQPAEAEQAGEAETFPSLASTLANFWESGEAWDALFAALHPTIQPPEIEMPILKRLGEPPFDMDAALETQLAAAYRQISRQAMVTAYTSAEDE